LYLFPWENLISAHGIEAVFAFKQDVQNNHKISKKKTPQERIHTKVFEVQLSLHCYLFNFGVRGN